MLIDKFLKFSVVGGLGSLVDFGLTALCLSLLGIGEYFSNAIGFVLAASFNYTLNRLWTFRSQNPNVKGEFIKFLGVSIVGLGINSLVLLCYLEFVGVWLDIGGYHLKDFWIAKILATGVVLFWNFFVNKYYTFGKQRVR